MARRALKNSLNDNKVNCLESHGDYACTCTCMYVCVCAHLYCFASQNDGNSLIRFALVHILRRVCFDVIEKCQTANDQPNGIDMSVDMLSLFLSRLKCFGIFVDTVSS